MFLVEAPMLNANEDEITLCHFEAGDGEYVDIGDTLALLESTKASQDLEAVTAGYFYRNWNAIPGEQVNVGFLIGVISQRDATREELQNYFDGNAEQSTVDGKTRKEQLLEKLKKAKSDKLVVNEGPAAPCSDRRILVIGAGGHAKQVLDALLSSGWSPIGCLCNDLPIGTEVYRGIRVIGTDGDAQTLMAEDKIFKAALGVGALNEPDLREKITEKFEALGFVFPPIVSGEAFLSPSAFVADGAVLLQGANVGPSVLISEYAIINQGANICHDSVIERHSNIAPGAIIAGACHIGAKCLIGMGATLFAGISVSSGTVIKNGESVNNSV